MSDYQSGVNKNLAIRQQLEAGVAAFIATGDARASAVARPGHYTGHPSGIECIQITRHMSFNLGNVMKYVWRADAKGNAIEDLEKAVWYLQDEIAKRRGKG